jgi:hypothetical protein
MQARRTPQHVFMAPGGENERHTCDTTEASSYSAHGSMPSTILCNLRKLSRYGVTCRYTGGRGWRLAKGDPRVEFVVCLKGLRSAAKSGRGKLKLSERKWDLRIRAKKPVTKTRTTRAPLSPSYIAILVGSCFPMRYGPDNYQWHAATAWSNQSAVLQALPRAAVPVPPSGLGRKQGALFAGPPSALAYRPASSSNLSESGADREACGWASRSLTAEETLEGLQCWRSQSAKHVQSAPDAAGRLLAAFSPSN